MVMRRPLGGVDDAKKGKYTICSSGTYKNHKVSLSLSSVLPN